MDPRYSAQDVLRCDLCETPVPPMYCDFCHVKLCKACVGEHLSDLSKEHKVVLIKHRGSTQKCPKHTTKQCELYCEQCDIPVCVHCISSAEHQGHKVVDFLEKSLRNDLKELEDTILPTYQDIALSIQPQRADLDKNYEKLTTAVTKQGENWQRTIRAIVQTQKSEIEQMKNKHLDALDEQETLITHITSEVKQSILDLKGILDSYDVSLASLYKSRNAEFRRFPPKIKVSLPRFSPQKINRDHLHAQFGSLSALSITTEDEERNPELLTTIGTGHSLLFSVSCLNDEEIWTCGKDKILKLHNLQGKLLKSVQTAEGWPHDLAVTRTGDLVYIDQDTGTVNKVKNNQILELVSPLEWTCNNVCSTSRGDLLVAMGSDDETQSKVVRYSGSTEKQTIQFDERGKPLYSYVNSSKYITENRNFDICVADNGASAVVVVNWVGKFRFRYTGHPSSTKRSFDPVGITTNSHSQILASDCNNNCIHILDQNGQFLRYIEERSLRSPWGLCLDTRDHLFVAEYYSGKVKKIKYI